VDEPLSYRIWIGKPDWKSYAEDLDIDGDIINMSLKEIRVWGCGLD
jgi:hypothetical protein